MPSGCGFWTVAGNPWPDGARLASNISLMAVRGIVTTPRQMLCRHHRYGALNGIAVNRAGNATFLGYRVVLSLSTLGRDRVNAQLE